MATSLGSGRKSPSPPARSEAFPSGAFALSNEDEGAWRDVIQRVDEVYSDLLRYEADLERKNAELEEAGSFIASVLASMSDIVVVCDGAGRILQINPAFQRLVGARGADAVGGPLTRQLAPEDQDKARRVLASGAREATPECELRFLTDAGPSDSFAIVCSTRFDHRGRRLGMVLTGRPVGEIKRAYAALHEAHVELQQAQCKLIEQEKMASLGRLVAGVAHELNNPISFVYGNIHCLERYRQQLMRYFDDLDGAGRVDAQELRARHKVDRILDDLAPLIEGTLEGATRVSEIVRNLRRLSFASEGEAQDVDLTRVISTAANWAARAKQSRARFVIDIAPDAAIRANEGQLHQVALNLIDNALDAVRDAPDPRVAITVLRSGGDIVIEVADNGVGLAVDVRRKIFEPFFTTKKVGEGTGLGLWISYMIVKDHGGAITAENGPDGGAVFTIRLPSRLDAA